MTQPVSESGGLSESQRGPVESEEECSKITYSFHSFMRFSHNDLMYVGSLERLKEEHKTLTFGVRGLKKDEKHG